MRSGRDAPAGAARASTLRDDMRRRIHVLTALTRSDLRARYGRGPWQLLKWLAEPFALVGVYLAFVTFALDRAGTAPGLSLACAVVPFQLVLMSVVSGLGSIQIRTWIILNIRFDRLLIPVSAVLTETVAFASSLALLAVMMAVYGVAPTIALLWLPAVLAVTIFLAIGGAYVAALLSLWLPDFRLLAVSFVRALFFLAPGLVALPSVGGRAQELIRINPLTGLFEAFRAIVIYGHRPAAWMLLVPFAAAAFLLALALPVYRREESHFAKVLG